VLLLDLSFSSRFSLLPGWDLDSPVRASRAGKPIFAMKCSFSFAQVFLPLLVFSAGLFFSSLNATGSHFSLGFVGAVQLSMPIFAPSSFYRPHLISCAGFSCLRAGAHRQAFSRSPSFLSVSSESCFCSATAGLCYHSVGHGPLH
jgi:hypothetical protein